MKLILNCSSSNENYSGGCDYALLDLDKMLAELIFRRIVLFETMKATDSELNELYFWNYDAKYFSPAPEDNGVDGQTESDRERLEDLTDFEGDYKQVAGDTTIPEPFLARSECDQMAIREGEVSWYCYPKHSDAHVTTATLPRELIQKALNEVGAVAA